MENSGFHSVWGGLAGKTKRRITFPVTCNVPPCRFESLHMQRCHATQLDITTAVSLQYIDAASSVRLTPHTGTPTPADRSCGTCQLQGTKPRTFSVESSTESSGTSTPRLWSFRSASTISSTARIGSLRSPSPHPQPPARLFGCNSHTRGCAYAWYKAHRRGAGFDECRVLPCQHTSEPEAHREDHPAGREEHEGNNHIHQATGLRVAHCPHESSRRQH